MAGPLAVPTGAISGTVVDRYRYPGRNGALSQKTTSFTLGTGTSSFRSSYGYDVVGNLSEVSYPRCLGWPCLDDDPARTVTMQYERGAWLRSVPGFATRIDYQLGGQQTHRVEHANGVTWTQTFDPDDRFPRPDTIATTAGFATGEYVYDGIGNIQSIGAQSFVYDRLNRLTRGETPVGGGEQVQEASYDAYGNLIALVTNGIARSLAPSASTNRLTGAGVAYDAAGSLTDIVIGGRAFRYGRNALSEVETFQSSTISQIHFYDAAGDRLFTFQCPGTVCGDDASLETFTLRGPDGKILRTYSGDALATRAWAEDHVYRGATLLANVRPDGGGPVRHVHVDHLGSTRQVTNAAGVEISRHAFHPFGDEATVVASSDLELKFTGHERDRNDGGVSTLDYLHARYTSPMLGRFLAVDPISGNPGTPQSWNRYAYTLNNPMRFVDPLGLSPVATIDGGEITVCGNCGQGGWTPPNWLIDNFL
ncbi:MAG: RHS repeat-associated core domain-containing protein, partial [Acidobacteriota bacterium]